MAGTPSEQLSQARAELAAETRSISALRERYGVRIESSTPLSPEALEQLRSLGYVR